MLTAAGLCVSQTTQLHNKSPSALSKPVSSRMGNARALTVLKYHTDTNETI